MGQYLTCTRKRGMPKKHVDVCEKCRWRNSCSAWSEHQASKIVPIIAAALVYANLNQQQPAQYDEVLR